MKIKLKNHFCRLHYNKILPAAIHSVVLNAIPNDKLIVRDDLINVILNNRDVKEYNLSVKDTSNMIDELIKLGCLKELSGIVLETKMNL